MKKITFSLGFISAFLWVLGLYFRIIQLPEASTLLHLGGIVFSLIFVPLLLINKLKSNPFTSNTEKAFWALGILSLFLFQLSILFKFFHLAGSEYVLTGAFFIFLLGFLPILFVRFYYSSNQ